MSDLIAPPAEISFTVTVKRAATGIEETFNMVGHVESIQPEVKESSNVCDPHDSGA